jgi:hypothetical protein
MGFMKARMRADERKIGGYGRLSMVDLLPVQGFQLKSDKARLIGGCNWTPVSCSRT